VTHHDPCNGQVFVFGLSLAACTDATMCVWLQSNRILHFRRVLLGGLRCTHNQGAWLPVSTMTAGLWVKRNKEHARCPGGDRGEVFRGGEKKKATTTPLAVSLGSEAEQLVHLHVGGSHAAQHGQDILRLGTCRHQAPGTRHQAVAGTTTRQRTHNVWTPHQSRTDALCCSAVGAPHGTVIARNRHGSWPVSLHTGHGP
jgi:hypothetical protein